MAEYLEQTTAEVHSPAPEVLPEENGALPVAVPSSNRVPEEQAVPGSEQSTTVNRYVVAGRKGAERIHQLIQRGRLYEQEHNLKRGRQRLRQLIEEGKLYEQ